MSGILHKLYHGETNIDFIGKRRIWFAISALVILVCLVSLFTKKLNFGIEFEGGVTIQAPVAEDGPLAGSSTTEIVSAIRDVAGEFGANDAKVQVATGEGERTVSVQTKDVADDPKAQTALVEAVAEATGAEPADVDNQQIGSK